MRRGSLLLLHVGKDGDVGHCIVKGFSDYGCDIGMLERVDMIIGLVVMVDNY